MARAYKKKPVEDRFWAKVDKGDESVCHPWTGRIDKKGYGHFDIEAGKTVRPHRFAYECSVGPIPEGLDLDHICHTAAECLGGPECLHRRCCNPNHLEPVTRSINLKRAGANMARVTQHLANRQIAKTHCPQGHEYSPENTYSPPSRPTARYCRQCHLDSTRQRRARR